MRDDSTITSLIKKMVIDVRQELLESTHYLNHNTLAGLCYTQADFIEDYLNKHHPDLHFVLQRRHGELQHSLRFPSEFWPVQHTIVQLTIEGRVYYVDVTTSQFKEIGLPDTYCSLTYPSWHLSDENNWIVQLWRFNNRTGMGYNNFIIRSCEWMEYDAKGFVYNVIRKILKKT